MEKKLSVWCKSAKIEMIRRDIKTTTLAKNLGMNRSYVSSILNGRVYSGPASTHPSPRAQKSFFPLEVLCLG